MQKKAATKVSKTDSQKTGQQEQQAFLLRFSDALRTENTPDAISNLAIQMLFDHLKLDCCYIGIYHLEQDYGEFPYHVQTAQFPPLPKGVRLSDFPEALREAFDRTLVIDDILRFEVLSDFDKQNFSAMGYRGLLVATIRKGEKNPLWAIDAVSAQPRHWLPEEVKLVEEVAERTWIAVEKAKTDEALRESEARHRTLFDSVDEGVCLIERMPLRHEGLRDYRYVAMNPAMQAMFGVPDLSGQSIRNNFPDEVEDWYDDFDRVLETGQSIRSERESKPQGLVLEMFVARIEDGSGKRLLAVMQDVTERKLIENELIREKENLDKRVRERTDELEKVNEALQKSNKELEYFAYIASHDLQEPLRMVSSFAQLLEKQYGDKLDARAKEYIGFAVDGAKRMYELINGLLAYSRITRKEPLFTEVDLNKVIDEVRDNLELIISETNCRIESDYLPVVSGDKTQMIQLFQNLVSNGIKFSPGDPHIIISARKVDSEYVISVKDEGIGIEQQYFDKIFQIFQRLHQRDQFEGTGIGLAICKKIVENHKGKIWVESKPGHGSVFHFTLSIK